MKNKKNIIIVVLVIAIFVMGYMLMVSFPKKAKAECEAGVKVIVEAQVKNAVQQYEQTLQQFMQIPACVAALSM